MTYDGEKLRGPGLAGPGLRGAVSITVLVNALSSPSGPVNATP